MAAFGMGAQGVVITPRLADLFGKRRYSETKNATKKIERIYVEEA
jgi:hypothetical protein